MKKRIVSIFIALVLCLSLLPGTALAEEISDTLDFTSQDSNISGDGYSWTADTKTLTLNNFTQKITGSTEGGIAISLPENATLVLEGESTITNESYGGVCIKYTGKFTIQGDGTLNLNLNMPTQNGSGSTCGKGIYEKNDQNTNNIVTIESGTLNIVGAMNNTNSEGYVGISGAEVHLNGGAVNMKNVTYGVNAYYWWVTARKFFVNGGAFHYSKSDGYTGELMYAISSGRQSDTSTGEVSITNGTVDISDVKNAFSVAHTPVSVTGGSLKIHDLVRQTTSSGVVQNTCAFLCGDGSRTKEEPKILLTGGNVEISGCDYILSAVNILGMDMLEVGEGMGLAGLVRVDKYGIYPNNGNLGVSHVRIYGDYTLTESISFHGGNSGFWDIGLAEGSSLTIPEGKTFDLSKLVRNGEDFGITAPGDVYNLSGGKIANNGVLALPDKNADEIQAYIKTLDLTGSGKVVTMGTNSTVTATYTNSGVKLLTPAGMDGTLDLSNATTSDTSNWDSRGYKWESVVTDPISGAITSGILTLAEGFNATKLILPDATVKIVTEGDSRIDKLAISSGGPNKTNLTFSGTGTLTIQEQLALNGGDNNALTVDAGATVIAGNGISIGSSGGVNGVITVKGTLTANGEYNALTSGKVIVGSGGTLNVYGNTGVAVNGMRDNGFTGAFTLEENGTLNANCEEYVIAAHSGIDSGFNPPIVPNEVISIPAGYIPQGHDPYLTGNKQSVVIVADGPFTIGKSNVPSGGDSSRYAVTVEKSEHGEVTSNRRTASWGDTVTLTVTPDSGYKLNALTVTDSRGNKINLTDKGDGKYTFTMPGSSVTVKTTFVSQSCDGGVNCPSRAFSDLDTSKWYHEAVDYVLQNGLMIGYDSGLFGPNDPISRAQFTQILYNKEGKPAVTGGSTFTDVVPSAWYAPAVTWAATQNVVAGYGNGRFGPNDPITREQLAVMLWQYAGSTAATEKELHFTDIDEVSGWALESLRWAVEQGIMQGKGNGILDPRGKATRAEVASMIMKYLSK